MNLFSRASQRLPLSPAERAFLRTLWSLLISGLVIGIQVGIQYLSTTKTLSLTQLLSETILASVISFGYGLAKYATANGDAAFKTIGAVVEQEMTSLEQKGQMVMPNIDFSAFTPAIANEIVNLPKGSQKAATPPQAPVQQAASSPNFASSAPSQPYQQAPVMPMNVPVNVSQLQT